MSELLKAGADARYFLGKFKSMVALAEMVDGLSHLSGEVVALQAAKKEADAELAKVQPLVEAEQASLAVATAHCKVAVTEAKETLKTAKRAAAALIANADASVKAQLDADAEALKVFQASVMEEKEAFARWLEGAEQEKVQILSQTEKLTSALDRIRAKLL